MGATRVALVGEAAHVTPPIGAQGLNLGFRDVETLIGLLAAAKEKKEDLGSDDLLRNYSAARSGDIMSRTVGADILNRSLLSDILPLQAARGVGLVRTRSDWAAAPRLHAAGDGAGRFRMNSKVLEQLIRVEMDAGCSNVLTFRPGLCKTGMLAR